MSEAQPKMGYLDKVMVTSAVLLFVTVVVTLAAMMLAALGQDDGDQTVLTWYLLK